MDWKEEILALAQDPAVCASLLAADADTGEVLTERLPQRRVISASTIKVAIMLCALDDVRRGARALSDRIFVPQNEILSDSEVFDGGAQEMTLDELIRWMIIVSDNTATNALIRLLTMEHINAFCAGMGLTATRVERLMLDWEAVQAGRNNYTSAADQCAMFRALHTHAILTPELCIYALGVLMDQRCKDDFFRYIPYPVRAAHKTGSLDGINHDSGLFYFKDRCLYLGVFVTGTPDENYGRRLIGRIAKRVYDEFCDQN